MPNNLLVLKKLTVAFFAAILLLISIQAAVSQTPTPTPTPSPEKEPQPSLDATPAPQSSPTPKPRRRTIGEREVNARRAPVNKDSLEDQTAGNEASDQKRRVSIFMSLASIFSSNIDRDEDGEDSFGISPLIGIRLRDNAERPRFQFIYEISKHSFTNSNRYDRVSQLFNAEFRHSLPRRIRLTTNATVALNGSSDSDNRSIGDFYTVMQEAEFRLNKRQRIDIFGAVRFKQFRKSRDSDAFNPYAGIRFEQRLGKGRFLEFGYRYDLNSAKSARNRYIRSAYSAEFSTLVERRTRLGFEARYRPYLYTRLVRVDGERVPRRDKRYAFITSLRHALGQGVALNIFYSVENRRSNDVDRRFVEHLAGAAITYRW
ncbi:MAG TPA: hypothetical protein VNI84_06305 [Pyrinomonadaceae bacterium]|nr:hypothetical protein [Pyrinomonadaceae bacterium]